MAFGCENVRPPPGELDWAPNETEIQEPARRSRRGRRGAGASHASREGNPSSSRSAALRGRVALCWDGGCVAAAGVVVGRRGVPRRGPPPALARGRWALLSGSRLQGWSCASLQILTNNVTGLGSSKIGF